MADHVDNIGDTGARRRRRGGYVWLVIAGIFVVVLTVTHPPREARLLIAIPVGLAALGLLQAREKTWVVHAALGKREGSPRDADSELSAAERLKVRWQALGVVVRAAFVAALAAAVAWVV